MITKDTITSAKLLSYLDFNGEKKISNSVWINGTMEVPFDENNCDYQQYKLWLADGNKPDPAD
tara:strand:+ start:546 stop:734 length:189 start_codon:yes stop_codon:yes gene_type:complete